MTDSVDGKRVAPALALLLTGFAVSFVLLAAATPYLASLPDISLFVAGVGFERLALGHARREHHTAGFVGDLRHLACAWLSTGRVPK